MAKTNEKYKAKMEHTSIMGKDRKFIYLRPANSQEGYPNSSKVIKEDKWWRK